MESLTPTSHAAEPPVQRPTTVADAAVGAHRLQGALFQPIGDEGRAELVERRIVDAITRGHLRAGERLPTESDLARSLGVAPVTVREALLAVRGRGLLVTRRGRKGGSFVAEHADPLQFAREALKNSSRLALRDLGAHYAAITGACMRLAARRADSTEVQLIRQHLARLPELASDQQRRLLDDTQLELVALSQSARLTREQMKLQAEFSPFLGLCADAGFDAAGQGVGRRAVLDAVDAGDVDAASRASEALVRAAVDALIAVQSSTP